MEIRLSRILLSLIFLFLLSCKGDSQQYRIKGTMVKQIKDKTDFFDEKFEDIPFSLIIDESNISDHPIRSYLDCTADGYFTLHYIPKMLKLQHFWKDLFLERYDFNTIDLDRDNKKIGELVKDKNEYTIFSYQIKKEDLNSNGNCSEENVYAKRNTNAFIYYYNPESKKWDLLKQIISEKLPPYLDSQFFIDHFPEYFPENKSHVIQVSKPSDSWNGIYSLNIDYGKLDEISEMSVDYTVEIRNGNCTFSGMGYKTYFKDQCKTEEKNNILILKYDRGIEGDGFSDHSGMDILGTIELKNNRYFIKSPIIESPDGNDNTALLLIKK